MKMHDKLRIGVVINENYHQEIGGGFGYYESLVIAIDEHKFNPLLEFVFVQFSDNGNRHFKKEFIQFSFDSTIPEEEHCKRRIAQINKIPFILIKQRLRRRYEVRIQQLKAKHAEEKKGKLENWLIGQNIDLLYYLNPYTPVFNFPFVTTHWDIGQYSMYAFPEVSMNGTFEGRERLYQNTLKKALAIFCESEAGKKELIQYTQINAERIFVIPIFPGSLVNLEISSQDQQVFIEGFSLNTGNYFLYPAQFWSHKNHYHLLHSFKKVNEQYPDLKLVLPGSDKGNLKYIKDVIKDLELQPVVLIPGFISKEALYSLYKNAIALVMPTLLGPTNMPLLESAYLGCPVITSSFDGHKEILGDYATYIDPLNENEIAEAMIKEYKKKGNCEKEFVNEYNTICNAIKKIEQNYLAIRNIRKMWGNNFKQF